MEFIHGPMVIPMESVKRGRTQTMVLATFSFILLYQSEALPASGGTVQRANSDSDQ